MSTVKEIVKALRSVGAVCRKKPKEEQYVCFLEDKGRAKVVVRPDTTEIQFITDEVVTEFYYNFGGELRNMEGVEYYIEDKLGSIVGIKTVGKGKTHPVYVLYFNTEKVEPDKIAKIAKNIAEKNIWVDIRYMARINLKKGAESFKDEYEFVEELLS